MNFNITLNSNFLHCKSNKIDENEGLREVSSRIEQVEILYNLYEQAYQIYKKDKVKYDHKDYKHIQFMFDVDFYKFKDRYVSVIFKIQLIFFKENGKISWKKLAGDGDFGYPGKYIKEQVNHIKNDKLDKKRYLFIYYKKTQVFLFDYYLIKYTYEYIKTLSETQKQEIENHKSVWPNKKNIYGTKTLEDWFKNIEKKIKEEGF